MSCIAIITARGGSKRIPKKNIKAFMGKPMIAYAIEAARKSNIFNEIMVSTDSEEIAEVARHYGANIPFMRSDETSSDFATTVDVLQEVINKYKENGKTFDNVCCIYPCVPFLSPETLIDANKVFLLSTCDALQPVCAYPTPIEWAMRIENGLLVPDNSILQKKRSQDLQKAYYDVGMFYFCNIATMLKEKTLTPKNTAGYVIDEMKCQDIDTIEDWKFAEMKYKLLKRS